MCLISTAYYQSDVDLYHAHKLPDVIPTEFLYWSHQNLTSQVVVVVEVDVQVEDGSKVAEVNEVVVEEYVVVVEVEEKGCRRC